MTQQGQSGPLTRRRIVQAGACCAFASSFHAGGAAAQQQQATLAASKDDYWRMTTEVIINGSSYQFVVDTASERTALAEDVAATLGLDVGDPVTVSGIARSLQAATVQVDEMSVGPFRFRDMRMPILPRDFMGADGYLGLDVISGSRITFDFKERRLTLESSGRMGYLIHNRPNVARVAVMGKSGLLRATGCDIDGVLASAFIDTGAEITVANPALLMALQKRNPRLADLGPFTISGVTGGEITGRLVPVKRVTMQDIQFTNFAILIAEVPNFTAWGLRSAPAILIGVDFLRQFASVTIDYRQKEFIFTLG